MSGIFPVGGGVQAWVGQVTGNRGIIVFDFIMLKAGELCFILYESLQCIY